MRRSLASLSLMALAAAGCTSPAPPPAAPPSFEALAKASLAKIDGTLDLPGLSA